MVNPTQYNRPAGPAKPTRIQKVKQKVHDLKREEQKRPLREDIRTMVRQPISSAKRKQRYNPQTGKMERKIRIERESPMDSMFGGMAPPSYFGLPGGSPSPQRKKKKAGRREREEDRDGTPAWQGMMGVPENARKCMF
jgi:hypothetical protein